MTRSNTRTLSLVQLLCTSLELLHLYSPYSLCSASDTRMFYALRMGRRTLVERSFQTLDLSSSLSQPFLFTLFFKSKLKMHLFFFLHTDLLFLFSLFHHPIASNAWICSACGCVGLCVFGEGEYVHVHAVLCACVLACLCWCVLVF